MSETDSRCPACGMPVGADDRFCGACGAALDAAPVPARLQRVAGASPMSGFAVRCCSPRAMRVGFRSSFCFRVESSRDDLAAATISLKNGDTVLDSKSVSVPCGECCMTVTPSAPGSIFLDLELRIDYLAHGGTETYSSEIRANVEAKVETPQAVTIAPNISLDGSVVRLLDGSNVFSVSGLSASGHGGGEDLTRYECDLSNHRYLALTLAKSPRGVTLASETAEIMLVHGDSATVGRAPTSDFQLPVFDDGGNRDDFLSRHISGAHFRIGLHDGRCFVSDGCEGHPSTNGTSVDGVRIPPGGSVAIATGLVHHVAAMYAAAGDREIVPMSVAVSGDRWTRKPSGLVLRREDGVMSAMAVVWSAAGVELSAGVSVGWDGARFCIAHGGERRPLAIGDDVEVGGAAYRVMPHHQRFPKKTDSKQKTERSNR